MKLAIQSLILPISLFSLSFQSYAQAVDTIAGCDNIPVPELAGAGCLIENYDIQYGTTTGYTPSENAGWCSTIQNDQYIGFRPNAAGNVSFLLNTFNCSNSSTLEIGIFDTHNQLVGLCYTETQNSYSANNLVPNLTYYIRIDG